MNVAASSVKNYGCCIYRRFTPQNVSHSESALAEEEFKVGFVEEHNNSISQNNINLQTIKEAASKLSFRRT